MRRGVISAVAALSVIGAAPARAAEQKAYAVGLTYATPALVLNKGDSLRFTNIDPLAGHDLDSDKPGLFGSPVVSTGKSSPVTGVQSLPPGTYAFHCSLHSWMHGELTVTSAQTPGPIQPPDPGDGPDTSAVPNPVDLLPPADAEPLGPGIWPMYGKDLSNTRNGGTSGPSWNEVANLGPVWSYKSTDGDFTGTPVVGADGTLVALSGGGTVFAIDAATGKLKWSRDLDQPLNGTAAIVGGRVYVPVPQVGGPRVVALDAASGAVLWDSTLDTQKDADVYGSPVVWNGAVYIGTSALFGELNDPDVHVRGSVVALDAATGARKWKTYMVPPGHDGGAVWSTPAIDMRLGRLYAGTGNAYHPPSADTTDSIVSLNAATGQIVGHFQATAGDVWNATGNPAAGPDYDFGASPNLIRFPNGRELVGAGQKSGTYWAVDRRSMTPFWHRKTGGGSQVGGILGSTAWDRKRVYGPDTPAGELWAIKGDSKYGWATADGDPVHFGSVSVANGVVYTTDLAGFLDAHEASTGALLAKLPLGRPSWGGVAIAGGSVFATTGTETDTGYVVAYRPRG